MIIAGEASGDLHGAELVRALQKARADVGVCGIGGPALKAAGADLFLDAASLSVVGITEVASKLPNILRGMAKARRMLRRLQPNLLVLIDFPDFNLRLAAYAKRLGIKVLYYISPQVWAWRPGRARKMRRLVDHLAVILPFEEPFFRSHGIPVTFVGHPLMDQPRPEALPATGGSHPTIGLLPGSRDGEVARHLPVMLAAARLIRQNIPTAEFLISTAASLEKGTIAAMLARMPNAGGYKTVPGDVDTIFRQSDLVVAASGTVTLQAAIAGTPVVIVYKISPVSYRLGRALIRVDSISLVNLIAGRKVVPELIQNEASGENISATVTRLLGDPKRLTAMRAELKQVKQALGAPGASAKVARIALDML